MLGLGEGNLAATENQTATVRARGSLEPCSARQAARVRDVPASVQTGRDP